MEKNIVKQKPKIRFVLKYINIKKQFMVKKYGHMT